MNRGRILPGAEHTTSAEGRSPLHHDPRVGNAVRSNALVYRLRLPDPVLINVVISRARKHAGVPKRDVPSGRSAPVQNTSAAAAAIQWSPDSLGMTARSRAASGLCKVDAAHSAQHPFDNRSNCTSKHERSLVNSHIGQWVEGINLQALFRGVWHFKYDPEVPSAMS